MTNVCKGTGTHFGSYFGSSNYYGSFGNRADYNIANNSSVTTYFNKKINCQTDSDEITLKFEKMGSDELSNASKKIANRIPRIIILMCSSLNIAYTKKQKR